MKIIKYMLFMSTLLIFAGVVNALPIPTTWTDTKDANQWISAGSTFTFNLAADTQVTPTPYTPGVDKIYSARLDIDLLGFGTGSINLEEGLQTKNYYVIFFKDLNFSLNCSVIDELSQSGLLHVTFDRACGLQWLDSMTLTASGNDNGSTPVPEPSTMLLLGSGIIGMSFYGRRRMKK
jgi:hypothetical protein